VNALRASSLALLVIIIGAGGGAWLAWKRMTAEEVNARIERSSGPWRWNADDRMFSDALSIARTAQFGPFPMGSSQVTYYVALADSSGERLRGDARYRLHGPLPRTRFWSIAAYDETGYLFENPAQKYSLSSERLASSDDPAAEAVQAFAAGRLDLTVGVPGGAPGTLPTGSGPMFLVFRVYQPETPLFPGADSPVPITIERLDSP